MYFLNDGHRLTVEFNKGDDTYWRHHPNDYRDSNGLKKEIEEGQENLVPDCVRLMQSVTPLVTGKITRYDHVSDDENGSRIFEISNKQTAKFYVGVSNAYNKTLKEKNIQNTPFLARKENERPNRKKFPQPNVERDGIMVRLPWRRKVEPGSNSPEEWKEYIWNDEGISQVSISTSPKYLVFYSGAHG